MAAGIKGIAQQLQSMGRDGDTILAHIMPEEAAMLKRMGGRGSVNPRTGLLEFAGADPSGSSVTSSNYGGGSMNTSSGSGFNSASWGGGGGMLSSSTPSVSSTAGGGWSPTGGGGGGGGSTVSSTRAMASARAADRASVPGYAAPTPTRDIFSPSGVGPGMLTAQNPAMSAGGVSFFGGNDFRPTTIRGDVTGISNFGVPTLISNSISAGAENLRQARISELPSAMANFGNTPLSTGSVTGQPIPGSAFDTAPRFTSSPTIADMVSTPSPAGVPNAPTSTTNAYNFVPNNTGLPQEEAGMRAQMLDVVTKQMFDEYAGRTQNVPFPTIQDSAALYGVDTSAGLPTPPRPMSMPDIRPTTSLLADRQMTMPDIRPTSAPQPAPLGSSLEELMGTVPVGNPMFPSMAFKQTVPTVAIGNEQVPSSFRVNVPQFIDAAYKANTGAGLFYSTPESMYQKILSALPEKGVQFTPGPAAPGEVPRTGVATYIGTPTPSDVPQDVTALQQGYDQFMANYGSALTPRSVTRSTFDMTQPGSQAIPNVSGGVSPQGFADVPLAPSEVGGAVATTLDTYFNELSQARTGQAPRPSVLGQAPAPQTVGGVPLYAEARPFSGPKGGTVPMSDAARYAGGGVFSNIEQVNNLPAGYLGKLYGIETGFGRDLVAKSSSARGPFQFIQSTGKAYGLVGPGFDNRMDLTQSAAAAGALAADNRKALVNVLGREPSAGELYLAHQQGIGGASALLRNPGQSAYSALKSAYRGDEQKALAALVNNGGNLSMTAGEFANRWIGKMERAPVSPPGGYNVKSSAAPAPAVQANPAIVAQVAQNPETTGRILDSEFDAVVAMIGGGQADLPLDQATPAGLDLFGDTGSVSRPTGGDGGGARPTTRPRLPIPQEQAPGTEPPVTPPPPASQGTGMDLTRQAYVPRGFAATTSPVYS